MFVDTNVRHEWVKKTDIQAVFMNSISYISKTNNFSIFIGGYGLKLTNFLNILFTQDQFPQYPSSFLSLKFYNTF